MCAPLFSLNLATDLDLHRHIQWPTVDWRAFEGHWIFQSTLQNKKKCTEDPHVSIFPLWCAVVSVVESLRGAGLGCRCVEQEREDRWLRWRYKGLTTFCTHFYRFVFQATVSLFVCIADQNRVDRLPAVVWGGIARLHNLCVMDEYVWCLRRWLNLLSWWNVLT